jgi:long-chain-fatty-acid--CoA ligase ACSBG
MADYKSGKQRISVVARHVLLPASVASDEVADYQVGKHCGVLPDYEHPIVLAKGGILSATAAPPINFSRLLADAAKNCPNHVALAVEKNPPPPEAPGVAPPLPWQQWTKWTWKEYYSDARRAAKAFMVLGVEHFGSVSIFGFNSPEWCISSFGAMLCGGKYVGIYSTDTPAQLQFKVAHSQSRILVLDGQMEFDSIASTIDEVPNLNAVVVWGMPAPGDLKRANGSVCRVLSWQDCLKLGDAEGSDQKLDQRIEVQKPGHAIGIIYTSGTTGNPKAVMIHHDGVVAQGVMTAVPETGFLDAFEGGGSRQLSYLPLSHIAGGLMDILIPVYYAGKMKKAGTVYFARAYDLKEMTLANRIGFVRPTIFLAVPRVYEKMQAKMMAVGASITGIKKSIATWAKAKGLEHCKNRQLGGSGATPFLHGLADKLILSKARDALGLDKCKVFLTGAAPIAAETLEYFGCLGMTIQNVYGMSESVGVTTVCTKNKNLFGTVGHSFDGIEVKCFKSGPNGENVEVPRCTPGAKVVPDAQQGEICFRGRHIMMGYMANPDFGQEHVKEMEEKNAAAIDQYGWLHSGDKGCIDTNGMVKITGRYKELIIGAGGENIAPVPVEENVKLLCPALSNVMMVGDNRKYNVALLSLQAEGSTGEFPGGDDLTGVALQVSPGITKISQAMKDPAWRKYIQAGIDATNNNPNVCQNNAWKIQRFAIVPRDFSIQTGEFTATLKLRRSVADEIWADLIDSLYKD